MSILLFFVLQLVGGWYGTLRADQLHTFDERSKRKDPEEFLGSVKHDRWSVMSVSRRQESSTRVLRRTPHD